MNERFLDFCLNEGDRVRRFAAKLDDAGQHARARELRELAERLRLMATEAQERAA